MEKQLKEGICVAIRMRPLNDREISSGQEKIFSCATQTNSIQQLKDGLPVEGQAYYYDKVFDGISATQEVYSHVAKDIVKNVVFGINGTIFAYGQTSSGKTHTMLGSASERGVLELAAEDIFRHISDNPNRDYLLRVSFVEIYNEAIRDLLSDSLDASVAIREDPRKGVYCEATEVVITDYESIIKSLKKGISKRAVESTAMNDTSSRSHTIFKLVIESKESARSGGEPDGAILVASLNLVDLAGSESVRHTGAIGQRAKEGGKINQSLLSLSRVIHALSQPGAHVSFRDSKLTRLLQPSLCGNAKMTVICCITPAERYLEETRSTLQFASRAKLVSTHATVNEVLDDSAKLKRLQKELNELRERQSSAVGVNMSEEEHQRLESEKNDLLGKLQALQREKEQQQTQLERLRQFLLGGNGLGNRRMSIGQQNSDMHGCFDATGMMLDQNTDADESSRKHRKKHRDTWCPGAAKASASSAQPMTNFNSGRAQKRSFSGLLELGPEDVDSEVNISTTSSVSHSTDSSRLSSDHNMSMLLEEAQVKIRFLEMELARERATPSTQSASSVERVETIDGITTPESNNAECTAELEEELRKKTEEIDALVSERDQIFQQLEIEMGANAEHEAEMQSQIERLTSENKTLLAKVEMLESTNSESSTESNEIANLQQAIESLNEDLRNQQEEAEIIREGFNSKSDQVNKLQAELEELKDSFDQLHDQYSESQASIAALTAKVSNLESATAIVSTTSDTSGVSADDDDEEIEMNDQPSLPEDGDADVTVIDSDDSSSQLEAAKKEVEELKGHVSLLEEDLRVSSEFTDMLLAQLDEVKASKCEIEQELARVESELLQASMGQPVPKPVEEVPMKVMESEMEVEDESSSHDEITEEVDGTDDKPICEESFDEDKATLILVVKELESKLETTQAQLSESNDLIAAQTATATGLREEVDSMKMTVSSLEEEKTSLLSNIEIFKTAASEKDSMLVEANNRIEALEQKANEMTASFEELSMREKSLQESHEELTATISEGESQISTLQTQLSKLQFELDAQRVECESLQAEISKLTLDCESASHQLAAGKQEAQIEIEALNQTMQIKLENISSLELEVASLSSAKALLEAQLNESVVKFSTFSETQSKLLESANQEIENWKQQMQQLQYQHLQASTTMGMAQVDIEAAKKEMEKTVQQISVELGKKEAEISRLMTIVTSLTERAEVAEKNVIAYQSNELKGLGDEEMMKKKLQQLQTTVDLLKGERDTLVAKASEAEKEFKSRLGELMLANDKLEAQISVLQAQTGKMESSAMEINRLTSSIKALEGKMQDVKRERDEYLCNLNAACDKMTELEERCAVLQEVADRSSDSSVDKMQSQLLAYQATEVEQQEALSQLRGTVAELNTRLKKSKDEIAMYQQELAHGDSKSADELTQLREIVEQKDQELAAVTSERDELVVEVEKALQQVSELTEALIESDNINAAAAAAATNGSSKPEDAAMIEELTQQLENMKENIDEADKQIESMAVQIQGLEDERTQLLDNDQENNSQIQSLRSQITELEQELEETMNQLTEMTGRIAALNEATSAPAPDNLLEELNVLMEAKLDAESKVEEANEEVSRLRQELRAKELRTSEEQDMFMKAAELEMDTLRSQAREMSSKYAMLSADFDVVQEKLSQASTTIDKLKYSVAEKEDIIASVENEMFALRQEMSSGVTDLAELEALQGQLQKALDDNESLHGALKQTKAELRAANDHSRVNEDMLERLRNEMHEMEETKDKRIAHLEKHKITKEHLEMITKLKDERKKHQEDSKIMKKQLVDLKKAYENLRDSAGASASSSRSTRSSAAAGASSTNSSIEIADLKSQLIEVNGQLESMQLVNQSLKSKLKECSKQLQEYEAERSGVIDILIAQGIDVNGLTEDSALLKLDGDSSSVMEVTDLVVVVQKLADKLAAVKASLSSLSVKSSSSSVSNQRLRELEDQVDAATNEAEDLRSQRSSLEKRMETMKASTKAAREEVLQLQAEIDSLRSQVETQDVDLSKAQATIAKLQQQAAKHQEELVQSSSNSSPEYQVLAEENLELFNENKKLSKEAATYKVQAERAQAQLAKLLAASSQREIGDDESKPIQSSGSVSSKKRSFGTDLSTRLPQAENIQEVSADSPIPVIKAQKTSSSNSVSKPVHPTVVDGEVKKIRTRAVPVVSTSAPVAVAPLATTTADAAPEEGCAQS